MALAYSGTHGFATSTTGGNTLTLGSPGNVTVGGIVVLGLACDNSSATLPTVNSISKPAGETNDWVRLGYVDSPTASTSGGVRGELWGLEISTAWNDHTPTVTLSGSVTAKAATAVAIYDTGGATLTLTARTASFPRAGVNGTGTGLRTQTLTGVAPDDALVGLAVSETNSAIAADLDTTDGAWASFAANTTGGGGAANVSVRMSVKFATGSTTQSLDQSCSDGGTVLIGIITPKALTIADEVTVLDARKNWVPNPGAEVDLSEWTATNCTLERVTTDSTAGSACFKVTSTANNWWITSSVRRSYGGVPRNLVVSWKGRSDNASAFRLRTQPYRADGTTVGVTGISTVTGTLSSSWSQFYGTYSGVGWNAAAAEFGETVGFAIQGGSSDPPGSVYYIDEVTLLDSEDNPAAIGSEPPFDGDSPDAAWDGTPGLSTSRLLTPNLTRTLTAAPSLTQSAADTLGLTDSVAITRTLTRTFSDQMEVVDAKRRNFVPNPSAEVDVAGWTATGCTLERTTTDSLSGVASLKVTATSDTWDISTGQIVPAHPGRSMQVRGSARSSDGSDVTVRGERYNASGFAGWVSVGGSLDLTSGDWRTAQVTLTTSASTTGFGMSVTAPVATVGDVYYIDGLLLGDDATSYFDGSTGGTDVQWTDTPHLSQSRDYEGYLTRTLTAPPAQSAADTLGLSDAAAPVLAVARAHADTLGLSDSLTIARTVATTAADNLGLTDVAAGALAIARTQPDSLGLTDTVAPELTRAVAHVDTLGLTDATTVALLHGRSISDTQGLSDALAKEFVDATTDTLGLSDATAGALAIARTEADALGLTDAITLELGRAGAASDNLGITDALAFARSQSAAETLGLTDSVAKSFGDVNADNLGLTDAATPGLAMPRSAADTLGLADALAVAVEKRLTEDAGLVSGLVNQIRNPRFEGTYDGGGVAPGWIKSGSGSASATYSEVASPWGDGSAQQWVLNASNIDARIVTSGGVASRIYVQFGSVVTFKFRYGGNAASRIESGIEWFNSSGTYIAGNYARISNLPVDSDGWYTHTVTLPSGTAMAQVQPMWYSHPSVSLAGDTHILDSAMVVVSGAAYTGPYFDGSQGGRAVRWTGTPNLSYSTTELDVSLGIGSSQADNLGLTDSVSISIDRGQDVADDLGVTDSLAFVAGYGVPLTETVGNLDGLVNYVRSPRVVFASGQWYASSNGSAGGVAPTRTRLTDGDEGDYTRFSTAGDTAGWCYILGYIQDGQIEAGAQYTARLRMRANTALTGRQLRISTGSGTPSAYNSPFFTIGTAWADYEWTFTASVDTASSSGIYLMMPIGMAFDLDIAAASLVPGPVGVYLDPTRDRGTVFTGTADNSMSVRRVATELVMARSAADDLALTDGIVTDLQNVAQAHTQTPADDLGLTDAIARGFGAATTDAVGLADATTLALAIARSQADNEGLTDATTRALTMPRSQADTLGLTDAVTPAVGIVRAQADALGLTDAATAARGYGVLPADSLGLSDALAIAISDVTTDTLGLTDALTFAQDEVVAVADGLGLTDTVAPASGFTRTHAETATLTDAAESSVAFARTQVDSLGLTDVATQNLAIARTQADSLGLTDVVSVDVAYGVPVVDDLGLTDATSSAMALARTQPDDLGLSDALSFATNNGRDQSDSLALTDQLAFVVTYVRTLSETQGLTDVAAPALSLPRSAADNLGLTDAVVASVGITRTSADSLALSDSLTATLTRTVGDSLGLTDAAAPGLGIARAAADNLGLTDAVTRTLARSVTDALGVTDSASSTATYARTLADALGLSDATSTAGEGAQSFTDSQALSDEVTSALGYARSQADTLGLVDTATPAVSHVRAVTDAEGLTDAIVRELTRTLADTQGLTDAATVALSLPRTQSDALGLTDTLAFALSVTLVDLQSLADAVSVVADEAEVLADAVAVTDALTIDRTYTIADDVSLTDGTASARAWARDLTDTATVSDTAGLGRQFSVADSAALTDAVSIALTFGQSMVDSLGLADSVTAAVTYVRAVSDSAEVSDEVAAAQQLAREVADSVVVTDATETTSDFGCDLSDTATVTDALTIVEIDLSTYRDITVRAVLRRAWTADARVADHDASLRRAAFAATIRTTLLAKVRRAWTARSHK